MTTPSGGILADIDRAVAALDRLEALGWDWPAIGRAIGVRAVVVLHVNHERIRLRRPERMAGQPWPHDGRETAELAGRLTALADVSPPRWSATTTKLECRAGKSPADDVRAELQRLRAGGWTAPAIARASGVPLRTLQNVEAGQQTTSSGVVGDLRDLADRPS